MAARRRVAGALMATLLAAGCATQRDTATEPVGRYEVTRELEAGQLRLDCDWACTGTWASARSKAAGLYRNQLWADLAAEVVRVGYGSDLTYFYLARAAEGLGRKPAAEIYYRLSMAAGNKCDGLLLNRCDGIDVPVQALAGLRRVQSPG